MSGWLQRWAQRWLRALVAPRMLYGWRRADGSWLAHTRISSATQIESPTLLDIADHVYVGAFNLLDASGGLSIELSTEAPSSARCRPGRSPTGALLLVRQFRSRTPQRHDQCAQFS